MPITDSIGQLIEGVSFVFGRLCSCHSVIALGGQFSWNWSKVAVNRDLLNVERAVWFPVFWTCHRPHHVSGVRGPGNGSLFFRWIAYVIYSGSCLIPLRRSPSATAIKWSVFSHFSAFRRRRWLKCFVMWCKKLFILRSWNNGMCCMSFYILTVSTLTANDRATQCGWTSAAVILTYFFWYIPASGPEGLWMGIWLFVDRIILQKYHCTKWDIRWNTQYYQYDLNINSGLIIHNFYCDCTKQSYRNFKTITWKITSSEQFALTSGVALGNFFLQNSNT